MHPYRGSNPETVAGDWARLRALAERYGRKSTPLLSGEWGYSELYGGIDRVKQAQYAVRQYLTNLASGVGLSIWYDWKDDGVDPKEPEHHFGTVYSDLRQKEAYEAVAGAAAVLRGKRFLLRLVQASEGDWLCLFVGRGGPAGVGWSTRDPERAMPRIADPTALSAKALARATRWVPLPPYASVEGPSDIAALLKPLVENLRGDEVLQVSDKGRLGGFVVGKPHPSQLTEYCASFFRLWSSAGPVWGLRVELRCPDGTNLSQECEVTVIPPSLKGARVPSPG